MRKISGVLRKSFKILRVKFLLLAIMFCIASSADVQASDRIEISGDVLALVLPATAGGLTLAYNDRNGRFQFAESATLAIGSTLILKFAVAEERPNHENDYSFPSLHSSVSFTSAEFIRKRYGWKYGIPAYGLGSFVAYSRVESRQHYLHDVIAGAAIGIASSYLFTQPYKGWYIQAQADSRYYGIKLSLNL